MRTQVKARLGRFNKPILLLIVLSFCSFYLSCFFILSFLPTAICFIIDESYKKSLSQTILGFNIFALVPYIKSAKLSDFTGYSYILYTVKLENFLAIYLITLTGALFYFCILFLCVSLTKIRILNHQDKIKSRINSLKQEWRV
ncbi:hypothetical protein MHYMCMPSP_00863 [Hyalomma marginatum]|uniref:Uncharacterized protein n=1 Tax=Hyalomma marginatum TaxID=34627 RepID=A0A8S4C417_9ACAR|nr:hypothetical protein MHYMCMPASI_00725 [Hyalomma marginatum]CAG7594299.1 hypothetical protein MHYMCMPSP_00863 [Hyalomma marginatum]